jgi:hypothetical protein
MIWVTSFTAENPVWLVNLLVWIVNDDFWLVMHMIRIEK